MLSIKAIGTDAAQQTYYDNAVAKGLDDYYAGRGEAPGEFLGASNQALGLEGTVSREQLLALFAGKDPTTGQQLAVRTKRSKVTGFDLTFSAPKSVSVLYAAGDDEMARVMTDAHDDAVRAALSYMEANAARVRRGHNGTEAERARGDQRGFEKARSVQADGFVAAAYRHRMSRNQDPQLHTHALVMNMAQGPEGRWTALDGQHLYKTAKAAGTVYQAHLRQAVRERLAWVQWGAVKKGMAEIAAEQISPELLKRFSTRRQEIEERAAELVGSAVAVGRNGMERIALDTRARKEQIEEPAWREMIRAIAAEHGLDQEHLAALQELEPVAWDEPIDELALAEELFSPEGLTANQNTFHERDVVIEVASRHQQGISVAEVRAIAARVLHHPEVVAIPDPSDLRFTTRELLEREQQLLDLVNDGRDQGTAVLEPGQALAPLSQLPFPLNEEQQHVLVNVTGSGNQIDTIEALAGTGKTTTANALRIAYEHAGYRVIGAAPTGRAQTELFERAGIHDARTIDSWVLSMRSHPHGPDAVFAFATGSGLDTQRQPVAMILDEAGMAHTRKSAEIIQAATDAGIKVIALGDSGQLSSVGAGGWLGTVTRTLGSEQLREVMRQRDPAERRVLAQLHDGHPTAYLQFKERNGDLRVFDGEDLAEIERAILETSISDLLAKRDELAEAGVARSEAVLISRDNPRRHLINDLVRERLKDRGELGHTIWVENKDYAVGDQVIARRNDKQLDVHNGLRGTIIAVDQEQGLTVQVENGSLRTLPIPYTREHVQYAYALTGHGMQGGTVEWAGVVGNPWDFTRNWSYTALSRGREHTRIYLSGGPSATETEQEEIGPRVQQTATPTERMGRRMRLRDDEDLALVQLEAAERESEWEWYGPERTVAEQMKEGHGLEPESTIDVAGEDLDPAMPPEDLAVREWLDTIDTEPAEEAAPPVISPLRDELAQAREEMRSIYAFLQSDTLSAAQRYAAIPEDIERVGLAGQGDPKPFDRLARREWQERENAREDALAALLQERNRIARRLGDPDAILTTEQRLRDENTQLTAQVKQLAATVIDYELDHAPECLKTTLGAPPVDAQQRAQWDATAKRIIRHRVEHGITDPTELGVTRDDPRLVTLIRETRRDLGLQPEDSVLGFDI